MDKNYSNLEKRINYKFKNKALLTRAMTHSSASNDDYLQNNQRLEFLGDAVLQLIVSSYLYKKLDKDREGELSKIRSMIVCADSLFLTSKSIGLDECIILGKGEQMSGGRNKKNILADAMESLIAAIYLDSSYEDAERFVLENHMQIIDKAVSGVLTYDFKTVLKEYVFSNNLGELSYQLVDMKGPEHDRIFYSKAIIGDNSYEPASGHNKKESEQGAAHNALTVLGYYK